MRRSRLDAAFLLSALTAWTLAASVPAPAEAARKKKAAAEKTETSGALPTIAKKTKGFESRRGFLNFYVDSRAGKIWLEIPPPEGEWGVAAELIYFEGLETGLGSNPVGLDRGQLQDARLLRVRRVGPKVLFEEPNLRYRAMSDDPAERRAAAESFATSVLWAEDAAALDGDGRSLVDFTSFIVRDAHRVAKKLREAGQGSFALDLGRSVVDPAGCLAFPDNVEFEAILTYAGSEPGEEVRATAPTAEAVTLVQHHSLVRPPDDDYRPRRFDPRAGLGDVGFLDYAAGLDEPIRRRWITRFRLQKADPSASRSPAETPIVFYVDPGAPEPVRSALVEGAGWWAEAFERAGFEDAFRVELLPEGAHPLDVRYNVIQWVHRSTRGWSYGGGMVDPRRGEIMKGYVTLGSLRVRQDRLLFEGLAGTAKTGTGEPDDPVELALARIRQLAAHEVGHALGLNHNFAASTYGGRASVMDYPAPLVGVTDAGELDFSRAYARGVGAWDVHAIRYAYGELPPGVDEEEALERLLREGIAAGLLYLSDDDARPEGAAEPRASLWDNGSDPVAALELAFEVRRIALERFGEANVAPGTPIAELQEVLAPLYFHHRYQLEAAAKVLGGLEYGYAVRGDRQPPTRMIPAERQRRALEAVLRVLEPERLDIPEEVLGLLAPRPDGSERHREMFASATEPAFDALGAAATAADAAVRAVLQPQRLGRLIDFHRRDPGLPAIGEVLGALLTRALDRGPAGESPRHAELRHVVRRVVGDRLLDLAARGDVVAAIRAEAEGAVRQLRDRLLEEGGGEPLALHPYDAALVADLGRFLERDVDFPRALSRPAPAPPGSPIGAPIGCGTGGGEP